MNSCEQIHVGEIEGYIVLYLPERDSVFCKNTVLSLHLVERALREPSDRMHLKAGLELIKAAEFLTFGCLTTTKTNARAILSKINNIKKHKNHERTKAGC